MPHTPEQKSCYTSSRAPWKSLGGYFVMKTFISTTRNCHSHIHEITNQGTPSVFSSFGLLAPLTHGHRGTTPVDPCSQWACLSHPQTPKLYLVLLWNGIPYSRKIKVKGTLQKHIVFLVNMLIFINMAFFYILSKIRRSILYVVVYILSKLFKMFVNLIISGTFT